MILRVFGGSCSLLAPSLLLRDLKCYAAMKSDSMKMVTWGFTAQCLSAIVNQMYSL